MTLPLTQTDSPADAAEVASIVRNAAQSQEAIYPLGGETALDYGLKARVPGRGVSLKKMNRVIDYPARDMTITVEAGITIDELQKVLAAENQELPIDVPLAKTATLGGALATNTNGPRRLGLGTWRDYVIGIEAVDGLGRTYHAGGRVVKNVAGYDFCRLLIGSCGTLGIVTQVTLKVKPKSETRAAIVLPLQTTTQLAVAHEVLSKTNTTPTAIEFLSGSHWHNVPSLGKSVTENNFWLVIVIEGSKPEADWMIATVARELEILSQTCNNESPLSPPRVLAHDDSQILLQMLSDSISDTATSPANVFSLKAVLEPSRATEWIDYLQLQDPACTIQAHALSGIVYSHHASEPKPGFAKWLLDAMHPKSRQIQGNLQVWNFPQQIELTSPAAWGSMGDAGRLLIEIRKQFDPKSILNPGRFW